MAPTVVVAVAWSIIFTVAEPPLSDVIVESIWKLPPDSVKIFLSVSKDTTVPVTTVESGATPVTVSPTAKAPVLFNTKIFDLNAIVGGLGDCWCSAPDSTVFIAWTFPISVPKVNILAPDPFVSSTVTIGKDW